MAEAIYETIKDSDGVECFIKRGNLVRCKDCVKSGTSRCPCHYSGDPYIDWNPDDDWFCADGERRTNDA